MILITPILGTIYLFCREPAAALFLFVPCLVMIVNLVMFSFLKRHYHLFLIWALIVVLAQSTLLSLSLGGFINYTAHILWGILCPLGAMVMWKRSRPIVWFIAYVPLVCLIALVRPHLRTSNNVSPSVALWMFVGTIIMVSTIAFVLLFYFLKQKNLYQDKSDSLLLNILPADIASVLRHENRQIANQYSQASVLFADIVGFTPMSSSMSADSLVGLLNDVFSYFDGLVEKYELEKIKTIGDCYMVARRVT